MCLRGRGWGASLDGSKGVLECGVDCPPPLHSLPFAQSVNPISGSAPAEASWIYHNLNPAKNLARRMRDVKQLGAAKTAEEKAAVQEWLQGRDSVGVQ